MTPTLDSGANPDELIVAAIIAEVIERRRRGEDPDPAEYVARHPHLRERIRSQIAIVEFLDRASGARRKAATPALGDSIGELIGRLSPLVQRLIYLRHFAKKRWAEIAAMVGEPEAVLRRAHARALRGLLAETQAPRGSRKN